MTTARRLLATLTLLVAASCGTTVPALADPPTNVRDGVAGTLEAGWVRALCATTDDGVKCALRFPEGARRIDLDYRLGGEYLGRETTHPYRAEHRAAPAPWRTAGGTVVDGVRLACESYRQRVTCTLDLARRFGDFNVTTYVAGWNYGGLVGTGVVL